MGKLFYVIGKSATGKDTIFQKLLENESLALKPLVLYTTRPMRAGEEQGVQYHFTDEAGLTELQNAGKVIELRAYDTVHGVWKYFTADTEATDLEKYNYAGVGVLESYRALRNYYGAERVIPIYIEVEDGERLQRALTFVRILICYCHDSFYPSDPVPGGRRNFPADCHRPSGPCASVGISEKEGVISWISITSFTRSSIMWL